MQRIRSCAASVVALLCISVTTSYAQGGDFYRGKSITMLVGADSGGGYDLYARLLAPYLAKYIEGASSVVVQNMPGAGGSLTANYLYNEAKRDGTILAMPLSTIALNQLLLPEQVRYDATKMNWIGTVEMQTNVLAVWAASSPIRSIEQARTQELVVGASNPNSFLYQDPKVMNALLGTKFKIVNGYRGVNALNLALERGEIQAQVSPWSSWKLDHKEWLEDRKIVNIIRTGAPASDLPGVPELLDLVQGDHAKSIVTLLEMSSYLGRSLVFPPGVPEERVALVRDALSKLVRDPKFVEDVTSRTFQINFKGGTELQSYVDTSLKAPQATVSDLLKIVRTN